VRRDDGKTVRITGASSEYFRGFPKSDASDSV
jgi:hypothetical protein